jgi:hypothetical protein
MTDYDNTNRGSIWKNDRKDKDTQPDFKGDADVNGVKFWVSAWKRKEGANPKAPALSFKFELKDEQPNVAPPPPKKSDPISSGRSPKVDMDDDIPFSAEFR